MDNNVSTSPTAENLPFPPIRPDLRQDLAPGPRVGRLPSGQQPVVWLLRTSAKYNDLKFTFGLNVEDDGVSVAKLGIVSVEYISN